MGSFNHRWCRGVSCSVLCLLRKQQFDKNLYIEEAPSSSSSSSSSISLVSPLVVGEEDFDNVADTFAWHMLPFSQAGLGAKQAFHFSHA